MITGQKVVGTCLCRQGRNHQGDQEEQSAKRGASNPASRHAGSQHLPTPYLVHQTYGEKANASFTLFTELAAASVAPPAT